MNLESLKEGLEEVKSYIKEYNGEFNVILEKLEGTKDTPESVGGEIMANPNGILEELHRLQDEILEESRRYSRLKDRLYGLVYDKSKL